MTAGIAARRVSVSLGGAPILADVDVEAPCRKMTVVVGPNGAGKTTLLRLLAGLLAPSGGTIEITDEHGVGVPLHDLSRQERARRVAYLPQERVVHWDLTVERVVMLGRLPHRPPGVGESARDRRAVHEAMTTMDVQHLGSRPIETLSGGERARVLMARALAQETSVLIADEPTAALDVGHQLRLMDHLRSLAEAGRTVVAALHDLSLAARYADQILVLHDARVAASGSAQETLVPALLARVYGVDMLTASHAGIPLLVPLSPARPDG
jgi:iron complex transport system ATP-binding protein